MVADTWSWSRGGRRRMREPVTGAGDVVSWDIPTIGMERDCRSGESQPSVWSANGAGGAVCWMAGLSTKSGIDFIAQPKHR